MELHAPETPSRWREVKALLREIIETVILSLIIFFFITTFLLQNFRVLLSSMEPTLHEGQFIMVNKLAYRLHPPERGDIIILKYPRDPQRDFIKRIIGLPGEKVEIIEGKVHIKDQPLQEPYVRYPGSYSWGPRGVGEDEFFVLGDNRLNSHDSRAWGMLPSKNIIGKASFCYWPPKYWGLVPSASFAAPEAE